MPSHLEEKSLKFGHHEHTSLGQIAQISEL